MTLVTPDMVETAMLNVLARHPEHLAALERQLGLEPQTIERLNTIRVIDDGDQRVASDAMPWVGLGITGFADEPERTTTSDGRVSLSIPWRVEVQVLAFGKDGPDAMQRIRWTAMTVAECLQQRLPRLSAPVEAMTWLGSDFFTEGSAGSTLARAEMTFGVLVTDSLTVIGQQLPPEGDIPAGTPGGPPASPYAVPVPYPDAEEIDVTFTPKPLTETFA